MKVIENYENVQASSGEFARPTVKNFQKLDLKQSSR